MTTTVQLRQMTLEPPTPGSLARPTTPGADTRKLGAVLVLGDRPATHLVAVDDVIEMLVALLSNLPYRAHNQEVRTQLGPDGASEVVLTAVNGSLRVVARMPKERWIQITMGLVTQVAQELTRRGAGQLAQPLLAVLEFAATGPDA